MTFSAVLSALFSNTARRAQKFVALRLELAQDAQHAWLVSEKGSIIIRPPRVRNATTSTTIRPSRALLLHFNFWKKVCLMSVSGGLVGVFETQQFCRR